MRNSKTIALPVRYDNSDGSLMTADDDLLADTYPIGSGNTVVGEYIAAAINAYPEIEELRKEVERLRGAVAAYVNADLEQGADEVSRRIIMSEQDEVTEGKKIAVAAYGEGVALNGDKAPPIENVEDVLRYFATVHDRFGNTCVTINASWGGSALGAQDRLTAEVRRLTEHNRLLVEAGKNAHDLIATVCDCSKGNERFVANQLSAALAAIEGGEK